MHAIRVRMSARVAAAVAATALTAGGIMAAATVVSAAPKPKLDATRLSISNRAVAHGKHHVDAVTGVLSSDDKGVAGETVALEARMGVTPRWKVVATGRPAPAARSPSTSPRRRRCSSSTSLRVTPLTGRVTATSSRSRRLSNVPGPG